tara:strand:- start:104 stop:478 length:375 start_codon:yes stop_codon:yes gene_type:complete
LETAKTWAWLWPKVTPSPALVSDYRTSLPVVRRVLLEGYSYEAVRQVGEDDGIPPEWPAPRLVREEGITTFTVQLPFTRDCGMGQLAVCATGDTYLILSHGHDDTWKSKHPPYAMHAVQARAKK